MAKKKKQEEPDYRVPGGFKERLKTYFKHHSEIRNADIRVLAGLEQDHHTARKIIIGCERQGLLKRTRRTKQAAFYGPGPSLA